MRQRAEAGWLRNELAALPYLEKRYTAQKDFRDRFDELATCQRYFEAFASSSPRRTARWHRRTLIASALVSERSLATPSERVYGLRVMQCESSEQQIK